MTKRGAFASKQRITCVATGGGGHSNFHNLSVWKWSLAADGCKAQEHLAGIAGYGGERIGFEVMEDTS